MPNIIRVPGGGQTKIPSDLSPLCPNFTVERNGGKVKISADKIQLNSYTNMVSGGVWAWGKTRPTKPTGENTKLWSRAELITTGKPYDGQYLGDVTPSDAVTETLLWLPENDSGKIKLVPFLVLSTDYLGGVYVVRKFVWVASVFGVESVDSYDGSTLDTFMQSYANSVISDEILNEIVEVNYSIFSVSLSGNKTVKRKVITVSAGECNMEGFTDGNKIPRFSTPANRIAYDESGQGRAYWTRTKQNASSSIGVNPSGNFIGYPPTSSQYTRPSFVLPKDFKIQQRPDGSYTVWNKQGLMTLTDVEPSTESKKVAFNIPETIKAKAGLKTKYAEFVYGMKEYNGYSGGLLTRNDNGFASGKMYGALWVQTAAYNVLTQYATYEPSSLTLADRCLHSSIRKILMSVSVKSTDDGGSLHDNEVKCLLLSAREVNVGTYETGTPIPYYSVQANRIMKDASGVAAEAWLRDAPSSPSYQFRFIGRDGQIGTKVGKNTLEIVPSICIPLDTPIRALADGTYDLVPEDPALSAQGVSTMADEEEVPLEIELDWPKSDPLIARQWVYNEKGVYQTMLLGGIASTEDAPAFELPEFTGNHAIFGDETAGRIELYESGTLTLSPGTYDFFLVGGGGAGKTGRDNDGIRYGGGGGGSGYTTTIFEKRFENSVNLDIVVGAGGTGSNYGSTGGSETKVSSFNGSVIAQAAGGVIVPGTGSTASAARWGGNGGSGGGSGFYVGGNGGADGANGGNGLVAAGNNKNNIPGGTGQGKTTRMFEEPDATLYAGGGAGSGEGNSQINGSPGAGGGGAFRTAATPNTGGGGGGDDYHSFGTSSPGAGGSGITIVRWDNN